MGGVDGVAGFNAKVDMDERIGSVGWVLSKGITPTRSGNAGQGQEAVWNILGTRRIAIAPQHFGSERSNSGLGWSEVA